MWRTAVGAWILLGVGTGRADEVERFLDEYEPHWHRITAHLWRNVKLAGEGTDCDIMSEPRGKPLGTTTFSAVADDRRMIRRSTYRPHGGGPEQRTVTVVTLDQSVQYEQTAGQTGWTQTSRHVAWGPERGSTHYYYHDAAGGSLESFLLFQPYIGRGPNAYYRPTVLGQRTTFTRQTTQYDGAEVIETTGGPSGRFWVTRLRPDDWLVASVEESRLVKIDHGMARTEPTRHVFDISYGPAAAGELPFPTAVRSRFIEPDGKSTPGCSYTFSDYRRHTPTLAELDIERELGVTMPDPGPRPPLPPRGEYLPDPPASREPVAKQVLPPARPVSDSDHRWHRLVRGGLLASLIVAVGLAAVWWRR